MPRLASDVTTVRLDDLARDGQTETRPARFCREKWLKQALGDLSGDPLPLVIHVNLDAIAAGSDPEADLSPLGHGFAGVP